MSRRHGDRYVSILIQREIRDAVKAAAEREEVPLCRKAEEFLRAGLREPALEPAPVADPHGKCFRCGNPAAVCRDCLREAEDVAIVRNRLSTEHEERLRLVVGGRA